MNKLPAKISPQDRILVSDPMLATGAWVGWGGGGVEECGALAGEATGILEGWVMMTVPVMGWRLPPLPNPTPSIPLPHPTHSPAPPTHPTPHAGGTMAKVLEDLVSRGADVSMVRIVCVVAAPPALKRLSELFPGLKIYAGIIDAELNGQGFIVPGLGDAGDRAFGTD